MRIESKDINADNGHNGADEGGGDGRRAERGGRKGKRHPAEAAGAEPGFNHDRSHAGDRGNGENEAGGVKMNDIWYPFA